MSLRLWHLLPIKIQSICFEFFRLWDFFKVHNYVAKRLSLFMRYTHLLTIANNPLFGKGKEKFCFFNHECICFSIGTSEEWCRQVVSALQSNLFCARYSRKYPHSNATANILSKAWCLSNTFLRRWRRQIHWNVFRLVMMKSHAKVLITLFSKTSVSWVTAQRKPDLRIMSLTLTDSTMDELEKEVSCH